jgi:hypothetical protein
MMKKRYLLPLALLVSGCSFSFSALEPAYKVGKGIYQIGKKVVIVNEDLIGPEAMAALKKIDEYAGRIDSTVQLVKEETGAPGASTAEAAPRSSSSVGGDSDGGR